MADSQLRILIDALWRGKGAASRARTDIQGMGRSADSASVHMAALQQRSDLLQGRLQELGREVAEGGKTVDQATREFQEFRDSLTEIEGVADRGGASLDTYTVSIGKYVAAATAAGAVAKKAFDLSEEGANILQLRDSFDQLNASVLQTPGLLGQMKEASRNTLTETQLMQGVLKLVAGTSAEVTRELAGASPQLLEVAKAAQKLNPQLGDTAFLYDSITTGIKRASPLILDNLGIVVKVGEANEAYAAALGKTVEQLSAEEKQLALLNATLEAGDNLIQQVGGNVDSQVDSWTRYRVAIEEAGDAFKGAFSKEVVNTLDLDGVAEDANALADAAVDLAEGLGSVGRALRFVHSWAPTGDLFPRIARGIGDLVDALQETEFGRGLRGPDWISNQTEELIRQVQEGERHADSYSESLMHLRTVTDSVATSQGSLGTTAGETGKKIGELSEAHKELARQVRAGERQADDFSESLDRLRRGQGEGILLSFGVDTDAAEGELEGFVFEWQGKEINIGVNVTETTEGGLPTTEEAAAGMAGDIVDEIQFERRYIIAAEAELDEKKWRQEMQELRPQLEEAIKGEMGISDSPLGADFEIPVSPTIQAELDRQSLMAEMEAGTIDLQALIDASPPVIEPDVDDQQLDDMVEFLQGDVQGSIDGVFEPVHALKTTDNLPELDIRLQGVLNKINAAAGTHHIRFVVDNAPAPPSGASGGGQGGPQFNAPSLGGAAPSLGFQGGMTGGGSQFNIHPGAIVVNGVSDPERAAQAVMAQLERRGMVKGARLR